MKKKIIIFKNKLMTSIIRIHNCILDKRKIIHNEYLNLFLVNY